MRIVAESRKQPKRRVRRRRRMGDAVPGEADALVPMTFDLPLWLFDLLEGESEKIGLSRAAVTSEWLEEVAMRRMPDRVRRYKEARG